MPPRCGWRHSGASGLRRGGVLWLLLPEPFWQEAGSSSSLSSRCRRSTELAGEPGPRGTSPLEGGVRGAGSIAASPGAWSTRSGTSAGTGSFVAAADSNLI